MLFKNDITYAAGPLQLSAGQNAGVEAVLHIMHDIFSEEIPNPLITNRCRKQ